MSNALAIAAVTRLLKDMLNNAVVDGDISADLGTDVLVTAQPPDRVLDANSEVQRTQLNLFLHRVTPNAALRNTDLPTRNGRGDLIARPKLALDLHYLLTAYATEELHAEILLGYAMELFHENAILPRGMVRNALQNGVNGGILPPAFRSAAASRLADQLELIKITPQTLSMDDMSKLWTALQTNYRTTVGYEVSVVLIEREQPTRTPLPVLTRGPGDPGTGRDAGVDVRPSLVPTVPTLVTVAPENGQPAARLGETVTRGGYNLDHGEAVIRFTEPETRNVLELAPAGAPSPSSIRVQLPAGPPLPPADPLAGTGADPGQWRIGAYAVHLLIRLAAGRPDRETNSLPLVLAPLATPSASAVAEGTAITVGCRPLIRQDQPVSVIVGQQEAPVPALEADTDSVTVALSGLPSGASLPVRLRVAGIDSLFIDRTTTPPLFDASQIVQVP
jgi:Pvc16 N-terminal domain